MTRSTLVLAALYSPADAMLDWDSVSDAIKSINHDDLYGALDEISGFAHDEVEQNQAEAQEIFDELKKLLESDSPYVARMSFPGVTAFIAGGDVPDYDSSDPSGAYSIMVQAMAFPEVLQAVGLDYA